MTTLAVRAHTTCSSCAHPVPLWALASEVRCTTCDHLQTLPISAWEWMLDVPIPEDGSDGRSRLERLASQGAARHASEGSTVRAEIERADVRCPTCESPDIALGSGAIPHDATPTKAPCNRCGADVLVRRLPELLEVAFLNEDRARAPVALLIGEDDAAVDGAPHAVPATEPVLVGCPACGAPMPVDGTTRTVGCTFCHARSVLPDDVWRELRPPRLIRTWYVWIDDAECTRRASERSRANLARAAEWSAQRRSAATRWTRRWLGVALVSLVVGALAVASIWVVDLVALASAVSVLSLAAALFAVFFALARWRTRDGGDLGWVLPTALSALLVGIGAVAVWIGVMSKNDGAAGAGYPTLFFGLFFAHWVYRGIHEIMT